MRSLYLTTPGSFVDFMVGVEIGGSGSGLPDQATVLVAQFGAAISETQRIRT